jgi:hypothetical protein
VKKRGSCGLKQALYEISWIDEACRWREVQNSFVYLSTVTGPIEVFSERVGAPDALQNPARVRARSPVMGREEPVTISRGRLAGEEYKRAHGCPA